MLQVNKIPSKVLWSKLTHEGLLLAIGPFVFLIETDNQLIFEHIILMYSNHLVADENSYVDYRVRFTTPNDLHRLIGRQIKFSFDGFHPFSPLPISQAAAQFEWAINWVIANNAHQYLVIHSAILEKNNKGLILPGIPGSGKSTLCSALIAKGWRLLSDEMALISIDEGNVHPIPRPVSLKNNSIDIIKQYYPDSVFGNVIKNTTKGDVGHMKAAESCVALNFQTVNLDYLIFPHYKDNVEAQLSPLSKGKACMLLIEQSFNFNVLGEKGFKRITKIIDGMECFDFVYPDLDSAIKGIKRVVSE